LTRDFYASLKSKIYYTIPAVTIERLLLDGDRMSDNKFDDPHVSAEQIVSEPSTNTDTEIQCTDCRMSFTWTAGEQAFFQAKGLTNPPKRCKPCKKAKNQRLSEIERARIDGKRHHVIMPAECATCGKVTTVPFYPSQGRPVYCRSCFQEMNALPKADANSA
jgi:CxxC-x17-CxxC domain-containing protein